MSEPGTTSEMRSPTSLAVRLGRQDPCDQVTCPRSLELWGWGSGPQRSLQLPERQVWGQRDGTDECEQETQAG